jgi:sugar phosphate isomerase/epimerase
MDHHARPAADASRRSFLKLSAALAGAAAVAGGLPRFSRAADETAADRGYGGLPMGIQTYTLRDMSLDKALGTIADDLKLKYVEIFPGHDRGRSPRQVKEILDSHGLKAVAYGVVPFTKNADANRKFFEIGKTLGIKSLSCDPEPDAFDTLDKQVEEYGIAAAIHPHGPGARWFQTKQIHDAVKDHHKLIGLCNDTGHLIRADQDPVEACHVFKDRLHGVHLKDFKKLGGNKWEDCVLGDGLLKVEALVKALLEMKYNGPLSLEYEGGKPIEASRESLARVRGAASKGQPA